MELLKTPLMNYQMLACRNSDRRDDEQQHKFQFVAAGMQKQQTFLFCISFSLAAGMQKQQQER